VSVTCLGILVNSSVVIFWLFLGWWESPLRILTEAKGGDIQCLNHTAVWSSLQRPVILWLFPQVLIYTPAKLQALCLNHMERCVLGDWQVKAAIEEPVCISAPKGSWAGFCFFGCFLSEWIAGAHFLSMMQDVMFLIWDDEIMQGFHVANWHNFKKLDYVNFFLGIKDDLRSYNHPIDHSWALTVF
jgi:hypothetical protein